MARNGRGSRNDSPLAYPPSARAVHGKLSDFFCCGDSMRGIGWFAAQGRSRFSCIDGHPCAAIAPHGCLSADVPHLSGRQQQFCRLRGAEQVALTLCTALGFQDCADIGLFHAFCRDLQAKVAPQADHGANDGL